MSIIVPRNSPSYIQSAGSHIPCHSKRGKLNMVPGIEHSDIPMMTDNEGSIIDISKNYVYTTSLKDGRGHYCFGLPYQDHNYGAPPPPTPPSYSPCPSPAAVVAIQNEDSNHSVASTTTEEAPEESVTRCICGFEHDDEYMICCDNCLVWQHIDCMDLDRNNLPDTYLCEKCEPRKLDKHKAKLLQARKKFSLRKISPSKQEPNSDSLSFSKSYKKKSLLQSPEQWQQINSNSQRFDGSTDSDEEIKNNERRPKTRSKRRKKEDEKDQSFQKKNKSMAKNGRERMELKRSRLRRNKNKESTSTADEEAQDAWVYSQEYRKDNFETADTNQYTQEVQHFAKMLKPQGHEEKFYDQLQSKKCHMIDDGKKKQLVSLYDIPRNQPLIEYKGKFLFASQFHDLHPLYNKKLYPFIMFYKVDNTEICVDSAMLGNDARFVRRSCKPNAEIRHMVYKGNLHLFLQSTKVIFSEDEITVPLSFNQCDSLKDAVCNCGSEDCFLKPKKRNGSVEMTPEKRRRTRRTTITADNDSSQSVLPISSPEKVKPSLEKLKTPEKVKPTPEKVKQIPEKVKSTLEKVKQISEKVKSTPEKMKQTAEKVKPTPEKVKPSSERIKASLLKSAVKNEIPEPSVSHLEENEPVTEAKPLSDHENEEHSAEDRKKMTREQRKIEAYMRAFNQMEKAQRRKQQALERHKTHQPKSEEKSELEVKPECTEQVIKKEEVVVKEEEKPIVEPETVPPEKEETIAEEVKTVHPPAPTKPKKGKRRRTLSRVCTRTNSGGSDILPTLEEIKQIVNEPVVEPPATLPTPEPAVSEPAVISSCPIPAPTSPTHSSAEESPKALKTKRLLLQEWLLEKSEEATSGTSSSLSPRSIHTELKWNMSAASATCYVRCTKDTPNSGGITPAHLRRSNSSGQLRAGGSQGSAKKRWLRQAMHDCPEEPLGIDLSMMEHLEASCLSPSCHGDVDSPGGADDIITPLKKRRLMRESIESLSPHSPEDTDTNTSSLPNDMQVDTIDQQLLSATHEDSVQLSPKKEDEISYKAEDKNSIEEAEEMDSKHSLAAVKTEIFCDETVVITEVKPSQEEEIPMEIDDEIEKPIAIEKMQTDCNIDPVVNGTICAETINGSASPKLTNDQKSETTVGTNDVSPVNQSVKAIKAGDIKIENSLAQQQPPDSSTASIVSTPVNKELSSEINCTSSVTLDKVESPEKCVHLPLVESPEKRSQLSSNESPEKILHLSSSESLQKRTRLSLVEPPEKRSHSSMESPEKKLHSSSHDSPEKRTHLSLRELPDKNSHLPSVESPDNKSHLPLVESPEKRSHSSLVESPEKMSHSSLHESPDKMTHLPLVESPEKRSQTSLVESPEKMFNESPEKRTPLSSSESPEKIQHMSVVGCNENQTSNTKSLVQQEVSNPSAGNETNQSEVDSSNADKNVEAVNSKKDHNTKDRPPDLSDKMVCGKNSSCSNLNGSNSVERRGFMQSNHPSDASTNTEIKVNGEKDPRLASAKDASPVKACASATQKRKVSLSEYRMRMKENANKNRTSLDSLKNGADGVSNSLNNLPAPVTLAPLPLFDLGESSKEQQINKVAALKKKISKAEDSKLTASEQRENLNERLKREFGFDLSEDPASFLQGKSKSNNIHSSSDPPPAATVGLANLRLDPQSLPPPPPPPRGGLRPPIRGPVMAGAPMAAPQYGYVHPPFSRPPYMCPQVTGAPYIAPQPPIHPPHHQLPQNSNFRGPLLPPSTHNFTPSMPPTMMRHATPVNAQRFATMVPPQPRVSSHKAYPHVYPSGLYK
ncbi:hypothetical protein JTE90_008173 [Oedothorax gibbosus]|uniref:SET domain-containing protein n=1 Tax=Oedothorax gibbosus TaxID=931172 RepID=A0AAV6VH14_9ARAC|nr:hypothetical protein JTE90_008173 [Oedothorax gibbosus]